MPETPEIVHHPFDLACPYCQERVLEDMKTRQMAREKVENNPRRGILSSTPIWDPKAVRRPAGPWSQAEQPEEKP